MTYILYLYYFHFQSKYSDIKPDSDDTIAYNWESTPQNSDESDADIDATIISIPDTDTNDTDHDFDYQAITVHQPYTNHSIRVTGATILTWDSYAASQIKEVTGHKSVSSLAIYQRVSDKEKFQMGQSLSNKTLGVQHSVPTPIDDAPAATANEVEDEEMTISDEEFLEMDIGTRTMS